jgi:hypothetical protein
LNAGASVPFSYTAVYVGTTADAKSSSAASTITVTGTFPTTSVLTSVQTATNPPPYIYTLTDTVTGSTQNYPTGTVSFQDTSDGNYVLGTAPIVTGSSTFVLTPKPLVPSATFPRYVDVGDLNGDGIDDIAVADFYLNPSVTPNSSTVDIYFGKGDGTFTAGPLLSIGATFGPQFAVLGDFNNDGCLDVLAESYANNDILLFLNTKTAGVCTGTFQAVRTYTPAGLSGPGGLAVGDFNRDGNLDFVVNNNNAPNGTTSNQGINSLVFFGDGAGNFTAGPVLAPGGTINPVFSAVGDFNGDGYPDIAIANDVSATIDIYLNNGTGGFTLKTAIATPVTNNIVLAADFNQDGKLDLAAESSVTTNPITIWLGNGDGTFTQAANPPVGAVSVASAAEADFNGDGIPDIIYNTSSPTAGGQIGVLLGKGDGTFTAPTTTYSTLGKDSLSLAVGDFNGDGYSDVVIGNYSGDLATPQADPNGVLSIYLSGYQTTGTATANLPGVTLYGASVNPHLVDAVFPTNAIYSTSTSNTVPLIPNILPPTAPNETLTMTATPTSTVYGQQVGLQATFTYQNILASSYQPNGETVTFYQVSGTGAVTVLGTSTFGTAGNPGCTTTLVGGVAQATCITTPLLNTTTLPIGNDTLEASFNLVAPPALPTAPGTNGADLSFSGLISPKVGVTVGQVSGAGDTVTATPNPVSFGSPTQLTFCIPVGTGVNLGAAVPTGTVQFSYGTPATNINAPVTIGTTPTNETIGGVVTSCYIAQTTTSTLPLGTDTVAGTFTPGTTSGYAAPSPAPTTPVVVTPVTPVSTVTTTPAPGGAVPACGTSVTLKDTLTQINGAAFAGTVQFYDNGTAIGAPVPVAAGGTASLTTTALNCGANIITAIFTPSAGSPYNTSNGGPVSLPLGADAITFPALPNTPFGSTPPVPAATATNNATPVTYATTSTACSVTGAGVITFNNAGSCAITASQAAGPGYAAPTPVTNTFQITPVTPPSTLTPPTTTPACGASTTLTDTITSVGGYTVAGTVQFYDNGTAIGAPVTVGAGGVASLTTTALSCGPNSVTAIFTPTAGGPYNPSTAGPSSFPVGADAITFPALPNTPFGSTPPVPAATATNNATPVTYATTSTACSVTGAGVITFNNAGSCAITASQAAGPGYAAPTPVTNTFQITPVTPPSTLTPPTTTPACGASTTLTDTITSVGGYTVAGTVQFYDNGTAIGAPVTVGAGGVASLTTTALSCGSNSVTAIFTPTAGGPYNPSTAGPSSFPVGADAITFPALPNTPFGSTPPVPAATATNNATPVTYATTSTACSVTGAGVITFNNAGSCAITASQAAGPGYAAPTPVTNTFQITPVTPISVITPPTTPPACGASVTLTDTITSVGGYTVAGTVQFYDNGTAIGAPVAVVAGGKASLTTTALTCGASNSITAIFTPTPGGPYTPSTAGPTPVAVAAADFTISATPPNQVVNPGDSAVYTVSLAGVTVPFNSPVALTATCNCQGVTISFANATVTPGLGPTTTTMTVATSPTFAMSKPSHGGNQIFYGLLLLPLLGLGKVRRKLRSLPKGISYCLAALVLLGGLGAVTGCAGGYYGPQPKTCTVTITGTSGTLTHSTTVTVTVR